MNDCYRRSWILAGSAAVLGLALCLRAGPMLPRPGDLPDEVRCLADIRTLSIEIVPLPPGITQQPATLIERIEQVVQRHGFEVVEPPHTPRLALQCMVIRDEDTAPGVVAVTAILAVHHRVRLYRLEADMTLPVATVVTTGVGAAGKVADLVAEQTDVAAGLFVRSVEQASRRGGAGG